MKAKDVRPGDVLLVEGSDTIVAVQIRRTLYAVWGTLGTQALVRRVSETMEDFFTTHKDIDIKKIGNLHDAFNKIEEHYRGKA